MTTSNLLTFEPIGAPYVWREEQQQLWSLFRVSSYTHLPGLRVPHKCRKYLEVIKGDVSVKFRHLTSNDSCFEQCMKINAYFLRRVDFHNSHHNIPTYQKQKRYTLNSFRHFEFPTFLNGFRICNKFKMDEIVKNNENIFKFVIKQSQS